MWIPASTLARTLEQSLPAEELYFSVGKTFLLLPLTWASLKPFQLSHLEPNSCKLGLGRGKAQALRTQTKGSTQTKPKPRALAHTRTQTLFSFRCRTGFVASVALRREDTEAGRACSPSTLSKTRLRRKHSEVCKLSQRSTVKFASCLNEAYLKAHSRACCSRSGAQRGRAYLCKLRSQSQSKFHPSPRVGRAGLQVFSAR